MLFEHYPKLQTLFIAKPSLQPNGVSLADIAQHATNLHRITFADTWKVNKASMQALVTNNPNWTAIHMNRPRFSELAVYTVMKALVKGAPHLTQVGALDYIKHNPS